MDFLWIAGGRKLSGNVCISGSKNASLPLLGATLLAKNRVQLTNLPNVVDIVTFLSLLSRLGAETTMQNGEAFVETLGVRETKAVYDIVRKMRASILVLGPLLARFGHCEVSLPGGCAIGARPVDLHLRAFEKMGAEIRIQSGYINAKAPKGLKGAVIDFDKITVTGTENVVMAAALAKGTTTIQNAACEPEVVQLCEVLHNCGVGICGIGTNEITIEGSGGELLNLAPISVISDRIEAGTYLCAGAITNSDITLSHVCVKHLHTILDLLRTIGFGIETGDDFVRILPCNKIASFELHTAEYPGFPTDLQAQFMALATQAEGETLIEERLFENRFMHAVELQRMGAKIELEGNKARIFGRQTLFGADVMATDLRASSALVLAALIAEGESRIHRIYHLDRGYERIEEKLSALGAMVKRSKE
ncbi:MAG: UDP-N-acetylglucosamine 1-carboxyvinyltransferase [Helicobacter sp.]|nr:UDP-N-acetylglucosamine 1-carboxyvinyltransferase [Helicobacter sp.]